MAAFIPSHAYNIITAGPMLFLRICELGYGGCSGSL